jgi:hypothetical protein
MRRVLLVVLLSACLPAVYARVHVNPNHTFAGDRWLTVLGPEDDVSNLSHVLEEKGFRVARQLPGDQSPPITPYVMTVDGVCGFMGFVLPNVKIVVVERERREVVFESTITDRDGCTDGFFRQSVAALDQAWPRVTQTSAPDVGH